MSGGVLSGLNRQGEIIMKYLPVLVLSAAVIAASATAALAQKTFISPPLEQAMQAAGAQLFKDHCVVCHGRKHYGPSLGGVVGRPAGTAAGFSYSDALKKSGLVWTEDNLRKWIADNAHLVPGTLMPHVSISDPAEQLYVIAYLKKLNAPAAR